MNNFFEQPITVVPGITALRATLLNTELNIFTLADLIQYYPFRYRDRTKVYSVELLPGLDTQNLPEVQLIGRLGRLTEAGSEKAKRITALLTDSTGSVELIWFRSLDWVRKNLRPGMDYLVYGKPELYYGKYSMSHPELELLTPETRTPAYLMPVYHTSEKMKRRFLESKALAKLMQNLLRLVHTRIPETLPAGLMERYQFISKRRAMVGIHFPASEAILEQARNRLKFEELFYIQLKMLREKGNRHAASEGFVFSKLSLLTDFYNNHLPFKLTGAQKRVIKEIKADCSSGRQMNRLLQGDVGSGKTIVAFICMLMALDAGHQACLMAPTEILAEQHFTGLTELAKPMGILVGKLTGSTRKKEREQLLTMLRNGDLQIIIGTHALLEDPVQFKSLGLCVIDEQHRFGVEQRSRLWKKNSHTPPHILVMTATPIPRTLAMTVYGDLDVSIIDELPPGRKDIQTVHRTDKDRLRVFGFLREQIALGRQIYVVYPLIEDSETMDYKDLMDGYESIVREFPQPQYQVSIVHGRMKAPDRNIEMDRFQKNIAQIMVATTVIEVGVNIPNASVMVIESAEKFGLSQLHQLRGRVGRGAEQSYCILMTGFKMTTESKTRIQAMVQTTDGFEIADTDLKLRGPGDLSGTRQSGVADLLLADLSKDGALVKLAHTSAMEIIAADPQFEQPENEVIAHHIASLHGNKTNWSRIS